MRIAGAGLGRLSIRLMAWMGKLASESLDRIQDGAIEGCRGGGAVQIYPHPVGILQRECSDGSPGSAWIEARRRFDAILKPRPALDDHPWIEPARQGEGCAIRRHWEWVRHEQAIRTAYQEASIGKASTGEPQVAEGISPHPIGAVGRSPDESAIPDHDKAIAGKRQTQ